jgi:hypothetical protein
MTVFVLCYLKSLTKLKTQYFCDGAGWIWKKPDKLHGHLSQWADHMLSSLAAKPTLQLHNSSSTSTDLPRTWNPKKLLQCEFRHTVNPKPSKTPSCYHNKNGMAPCDHDSLFTFKPYSSPGPRKEAEEVLLALSKLDLNTSCRPSLHMHSNARLGFTPQPPHTYSRHKAGKNEQPILAKPTV